VRLILVLQWNISDYFYQNQDKLSNSLNGDEAIFPEFPGTPNMPPFDKLWMCLYARLGKTCEIVVSYPVLKNIIIYTHNEQIFVLKKMVENDLNF
jgi:C-terminal region of Mon2 protein